MDISAAPGGAAEPKGQFVQGGSKGVGQGRATGKPGQAPACWLPDMLVVAAEGLVDMEHESKVLAGTLKLLRGQQLELVGGEGVSGGYWALFRFELLACYPRN